MEPTLPKHVLTAELTFYRTYSRRKNNNSRESWAETCLRTTSGMQKVGKLSEEDVQLLLERQQNIKTLPSGRWLWVGGTEFINQPDNFYAAYNCCGLVLNDYKVHAQNHEYLMMGVGVGTYLDKDKLEELPAVYTKVKVNIITEPGGPTRTAKHTELKKISSSHYEVLVGDSRQGWVEGGLLIKLLATSLQDVEEVVLDYYLQGVRPAGTPIKGFGGVTNPSLLGSTYTKIADVLNGAYSRPLTTVEHVLLLGLDAKLTVAGNVRRSARINSANEDDLEFKTCKQNLWTQTETGDWIIDPKRDALRYANHSIVYKRKPSLDEIVALVEQNYTSGEGALWYAPEAVARANADLWETEEEKVLVAKAFIEKDVAYFTQLTESKYPNLSKKELQKEVAHRMQRFISNPCGEIIGADFLCNLSEVHLNNHNPLDLEDQIKSFKAGALSVSTLLNHKFTDSKMQYSREIDPIVAVCVTGLFDFFVYAFGESWLRWWLADREPSWSDISAEGQKQLESCAALFNVSVNKPAGKLYKEVEIAYMSLWKQTVVNTIKEYCTKNKLRVPNRCTALQPSGTKSLLSGASPGWHPPKSQRYIRRITFEPYNPVALAAIDLGYSVLPGQKDTDKNGVLLTDPYNSKVTEWLVEIPVEVPWATLPGVDNISIESISAKAQFDFWLSVQQNYSGHNVSATIEFRKNEIETLANCIYQAIQNDEGYISAALLARFDDLESFPRLPFEPISKEKYAQLIEKIKGRRTATSFHSAMVDRDKGPEQGPQDLACSSSACELKFSE